MSGGTIPAIFLGNQIFVSVGECGLGRDTDALIWKLCVSLFCWIFLTCLRVVSVGFSWATVWLSERCCVLCSLARPICWLPLNLGRSTRMQQVRNLCIIKHIHVRAKKPPQDLNCMWVSTPLFLYLFFQSSLTQLINFFSSSSSSFFFYKPNCHISFPGKGMCWKTALLLTDRFFFATSP